MVNVLISEFIDENSLEKLKKKHKVYYDKDLYSDPEKLKNKIKDFHSIIVRNKTKVDKFILENAKILKFVGRLGVGLDNIDTEYCKKHNIHVQPATGMNADSVAEYVITSAMYLIKNMSLFTTEIKTGNWPRTKYNSKEIANKVIGIIGFGTIGRKVSILAQKLRMKVFAFDPYLKNIDQDKFEVQLLEINDLYAQSDVISLHLPLTDETKNFINKDSLNKMKKNPIIINSSRGSVVNENDLIEAYKNNLISGFALDVFTNEPINKDFSSQITNDMNCILTPHISGVTLESNIRVSEFITNELIDFFN